MCAVNRLASFVFCIGSKSGRIRGRCHRGRTSILIFSIGHIIGEDIVLHEALEVFLGLLHRVGPVHVSVVVREPERNDNASVIDELDRMPPRTAALSDNLYTLNFHMISL
jgi:hypothetical protein